MCDPLYETGIDPLLLRGVSDLKGFHPCVWLYGEGERLGRFLSEPVSLLLVGFEVVLLGAEGQELKAAEPCEELREGS